MATLEIDVSYSKSPTSRWAEASRSYVEHVNPIWVKLLDALGMNVHYTHSSGAEIFTEDGLAILDCLSGYSVHNVGHNHP